MDDAQRAALAAQHLDLPRRAAKIIAARVREHVDFDDLVALGNLGLAEAVDRYDPAAGASFRTFAWYRVQGAILDGVRRNTNLPRRVWARLTALTATAEYLEASGGRAAAARATAATPTTADRLREVQPALGAIRTMCMVSIDVVPEDTFAQDTPALDDALGRRRQAEALHAALAKLPERERALLTAHYVDGLTLLDAGAAMGMSKSWASRLHARAVDQLRALLAEDTPAP
ncbi:MAG: sigma-70 family RNA polymerase sigma factor [Myxococcales bacterium]|nr:sigma-70 family RNA polymerase sigma factor [Myxococcales bacterium]